MRLFILLSTLVVYAGCSSVSTQPTVPGNNPLQPFAANQYPIAATNVLSIEVYQEKDLSGEYFVDPDGSINVPLVGRVSVAELNVRQVEKKLTEALSRGYLVDPHVRVAIVKYGPVFVTGEVVKPGQYEFTPGMSVQQAVTMAGGPTRFASSKYYLQRDNAREDNRLRVTSDSLMFPGDIVSVGERLF